ncbi:hypothetical protein, partial [Rhodobacter capsulatus]|uniref:hypothetical protein n=1 Tax=Rhodobacter capsulatus TaxID=1061 RepID=UPI001F300134
EGSNPSLSAIHNHLVSQALDPRGLFHFRPLATPISDTFCNTICDTLAQSTWGRRWQSPRDGSVKGTLYLYRRVPKRYASGALDPSARYGRHKVSPDKNTRYIGQKPGTAGNSR